MLAIEAILVELVTFAQKIIENPYFLWRQHAEMATKACRAARSADITWCLVKEVLLKVIINI